MTDLMDATRSREATEAHTAAAAPREATVAELEARVDDLSARLNRVTEILGDMLADVLAARPAGRAGRRHLQAVPAGTEAGA
ncbi:hypothetical protein [Actinomadura sp. NTSP31]|uniref:hypothetical protein n=1 Tax=Actinomadura sp. NTSP31 TaxID=1735447 RepID=UPI0035BF2F2F